MYTEKRYAQIEKELLAIVFAGKRFHQYIFGRPVTVQSDHKPLEAIIRKPLNKAPAQLQGMLLQLQKYDLIITYTPGKHIYLSIYGRHTVTSHGEQRWWQCEQEPLWWESCLRHGGHGCNEWGDTQPAADSILLAVCEKHLNSWPARRHSLDKSLHSSWPMRQNISVQNDIVMIGDKIIIPQSYRKVILEKLHQAYQGVQRTKAKAKKVLYWPGITCAIEMTVEKCMLCQQCQPQQQKEPLITHEVPELPWMKAVADIFQLKGQSYLLLVDYLTKYPKALNLPDLTAQTVIQKMETFVCARHGIPKELASNHVPFASYEMRSLAASWKFKLTHSSPGYP